MVTLSSIRTFFRLTSILILGVIIWKGWFGYGIDFYKSYNEIGRNWSLFPPVDWLGWFISTFGIGEIHLGIFITTFLLAISVAYYVDKQFIKYKSVLPIIFLIISYPIIFLSVNVLRQGLLIALYIYILGRDLKSIQTLILIPLLPCLHNFGLILMPILLVERFIKNKALLFFGTVISLAIFVYLISTFKIQGHIINGFNMSMIYSTICLISLFAHRVIKKFIIRYNVLVLSILVILLTFLGLNTEAERVFLIILLPISFAYLNALRLKKNFFQLYSLVLLLITILMNKWNDLL